MKTTIIAAFFACLFATGAAARATPGWDQSVSYGCDMSSGRYCAETKPVARKIAHQRARQPSQHRALRAKVGKGGSRVAKTRPAGSYAAPETGAKIVSHPDGCPPRDFCGCGTALYLLGKHVTEGGLAIAANWLGFPRAVCAPSMAAARHGHVFAIIECLPGNRALAYDPNSGRHQTRIHVRSLAGYRVVNPHQVAALQ